MAITIIHKGQIPDRTLQGTCRNCRTVIEGQPEDCKHHSDQRDGDYHSAACPVCNRDIIMTKKPRASTAYNER
jgi:RNase P subunit RPR2